MSSSLSLASLEPVIVAIHAAPPRVVIEFAGAGAQALAWLHGVGGSSRTILEATDRYAPASLTGLIGSTPEKFTSPEVARAMATKAFIRAGRLASPDVPVAGVGCTAAIATDRAKRGEHRACVAACTAEGVVSYSLSLTKGRRTRQEEEALVSLLILRAIARICQVEGLPALDLAGDEGLTETFDAVDLLARLLAGEFNWLLVWPNGRMEPGNHISSLALLSGSFNPLHEGHRQLAVTASQRLGRTPYFELPLVNADKAPIDPAEVRRRLAQFTGYAPVLLTTAPLFSHKAQLFPHSTFILGVDTALRLVEPRFYNNDPAGVRASLETLRLAGCQILVASRQLPDGRFLTLADVAIPEGYRELFVEIPAEEFRVDISSTELRTATRGNTR